MPTVKNLGLLLLSASLLSACSSQTHNEALSSNVSTSQAIEEGVPGGVTTAVEEINAVVTAIDYAKRSFTLKDAQGHQRSFKAPEQMINFPQLKVGDRLNATAIQEEVVYLRAPDASQTDGGAALLAAPPAGSKPGMLVADSVEISARVKAIDSVQRTATLEFADGSLKTVHVRPDVQLKPEYLNSQVVIRLSSALAIRVQGQ
jgi:hypothetical protein